MVDSRTAVQITVYAKGWNMSHGPEKTGILARGVFAVMPFEQTGNSHILIDTRQRYLSHSAKEKSGETRRVSSSLSSLWLLAKSKSNKTGIVFFQRVRLWTFPELALNLPRVRLRTFSALGFSCVAGGRVKRNTRSRVRCSKSSSIWQWRLSATQRITGSNLKSTTGSYLLSGGTGSDLTVLRRLSAVCKHECTALGVFKWPPLCWQWRFLSQALGLEPLTLQMSPQALWDSGSWSF